MDRTFDNSNDRWRVACGRIAQLAAQYAKNPLPPPADDWERWCREMESRKEFLSFAYFPSDGATLTFGYGGSFSHETQEQAAWRDASNRMKRAIDLWKKHADSVADDWGRWCTNRGANQSGGRLKDW